MNISLLLDTLTQTLRTGLRSILEKTQDFIMGLRYSDGNDENDKNK